jgi:hypothetical protein
MDTTAVSRFLELIQRELRAEDVYLRVGGTLSERPDHVHVEIGPLAWLVAAFKAPLVEREKVEARLAALASTFRGTVDAALTSVPFNGTSSDLVRQRLDQELGLLAERAGAVRAAVFDFDSPVVWGASLVGAEVAEAANQRLERAVKELRELRVTELRRHYGQTLRLELDGKLEVLARPFASIYVLALFFDSPVSEPIAVGAMLHALHLIERLVLSLPPIDPEPGAKVLKLFKDK